MPGSRSFYVASTRSVIYDSEVLVILPQFRRPLALPLGPSAGRSTTRAPARIMPQPHPPNTCLLDIPNTFHICPGRDLLLLQNVSSFGKPQPTQLNSHSSPKGSLREGKKQERRKRQPHRAPACPRRGRGHEPNQPRHSQRAQGQMRPDPESVPLDVHLDVRELKK